ncbi:EmrB/QacA subfamily drug resistance transporter [Haloactinopolyspora alba]|uniref:EmrB/QacA subfamily drug resistance transporter n=1 Tax=Haloactinopolyspora alba TaxID=648780 RepID=A0A2P8EFN4_9ACTN|nr:DHA2 family efflux MFS transporter permease subunit [Haloactinopolyspora alba]PSL08254.1 EmrB/QacA subfamily drug resistance transporter [Haloactinopolyspora alba]
MRRWRGNPWAILLTLCLGFFMVLLDVTIVNIAIPSMMGGLGASLDEILWVVNSYVIMLAVLVITAGRIGDLRGQRAMFMLGVAVFTAASLACGLAQGPVMLIAARVVQGTGAAILMPQTSALLIMTFPPQKRGAAFGVWGAVGGVATVAGPTLGGLLVTAFDWRWIFFVNIPVGVLVLTMAWLIIPESSRRESRSLDVPGVLLASAALVFLTFGLVEGERFGWGRITGFVSIPLLLSVGAVMATVFIVYQARRQDREPLVPFALFRDRNYSVMNVVAALVSVAMVGTFLPVTIYLQSALGFTALHAGLTMAPMSAMSMVVAPFAGRLTDRIGGKYILMTGLSLFGAGMGTFVLIATVESQWWNFLPSLLVAGVGLGCVFAPMNTVAMRHVPDRLAGAASGVLNTDRQLGQVMGSAVVGAVLQSRLAASLHSEAVAAATELPEAARQPFIDGFEGAAEGGLQVSTGQNAVDITPPPGVPEEVVRKIGEMAHEVFVRGYVDAMKPTLIVPVASVACGAILCLAVKRGRTSRDTDGGAGTRTTSSAV